MAVVDSASAISHTFRQFEFEISWLESRFLQNVPDVAEEALGSELDGRDIRQSAAAVGRRLATLGRLEEATLNEMERVKRQFLEEAEASIRTAQYGQLMAQGKHLEEEVSPRGQGGPEHRDRLERVAHGP
jgi:hypothetical protein